MFDGVKANFKETSYLWYIACLRIAVGYFFFQAGWTKLTGRFISNNMLLTTLNEWVQHIPTAWYKNFMVNFVMPHTTIFSYLVVYGEIFIGLALMFGLMTRLSAAVAFVMNLNYHLATSWQSGAAGMINKIFIICELVILISAAGRVFGLDRILHKKYPRIPVW
ncbi:MAG: DoxX family membrane protein [bacterium]|nr:DoxX family membrane protein [bacterium]